MRPTPGTAHLHAVNDNLEGAGRPAPMHPVEAAAFDAARAQLAGRPSLLDALDLNQVVAGDPTVGNTETLDELRRGEL